jgi:hypothetical protein
MMTTRPRLLLVSEFLIGDQIVPTHQERRPKSSSRAELPLSTLSRVAAPEGRPLSPIDGGLNQLWLLAIKLPIGPAGDAQSSGRESKIGAGIRAVSAGRSASCLGRERVRAVARLDRVDAGPKTRDARARTFEKRGGCDAGVSLLASSSRIPVAALPSRRWSHASQLQVPYPPFSAPTSAWASAESHLAPPSIAPISHPFLSMTRVTGNPSALPSRRRVSNASPLGSA